MRRSLPRTHSLHSFHLLSAPQNLPAMALQSRANEYMRRSQPSLPDMLEARSTRPAVARCKNRPLRSSRSRTKRPLLSFIWFRRRCADGLAEGFIGKLLRAALSLSAASDANEYRLPVKFCASTSRKLSYSELAEGISLAVG